MPPLRRAEPHQPNEMRVVSPAARLIHPAILLDFSGLLRERYHLTDRKAVELAETLLRDLHTLDLDIVRGDWMNDPQHKEALSWEDIAATADALVEQRGGVPPWRTPELS